MLRFPVQWKIPKFCNSSDPCYSKLASNEEWTIEFDYKTLRISRKSVCEEILVFGWISYPNLDCRAITQEFAKLMKPTSSSLKVVLKDPYVASHYFSFGYIDEIKYDLSGMVYITSSSGKTGNIDECKNCQLLEKFSNDFERLLDPETSTFSDFHLKCGDVLIPTHKNILSARSPVFAAMFAHEMKENQKKEVVITDINESGLWSMVTFMYTGKVSLTVALASDLLFAANKYQMDDLKKVCCDFLKENISSENMLNLYVLGDLHAEDLKSFVKDYICKVCTDFSAFETTEEWKTFRKEKPNLALDVIISMVKSRDRK